jgi:hypothetical protein
MSIDTDQLRTGRTMRSSRLLIHLVLLAVTPAACSIEKTEHPLSPSLAGPIPGVEISPPKLLQPIPSQSISTETQPLTLLIENPSSNGPRPLTLTVEVASDAAFTNKVFTRTGIPLGTGGRTSVRLPDALTSGRTYFWRARAEDGANTGPFSASGRFTIFTPVIIGRPTLVGPVGGVQTADYLPRFRVINAPRSGPAGRITYAMEVADTDSFGNKIAVWTFPEQADQSTLKAPAPLPPAKKLFWRVRAYDEAVSGGWSDTGVFLTPALPAPTPPPPPPPGGPGGPRQGSAGHIPAGPANEDRAKQVVFGTANEFPHLLAVFPSESQAIAAAQQLLLRTIWHLHLAGFQAGRQRNPSGLVSNDKLTIFINGAWHVYDIYSLGVANRATRVQWLEITGANHVPDGGIPD